MEFLFNILKGIAIGAGAIIPGISSGVLCVIFGFYEKLIDSIINFFHDFKNSIKLLLPITIGAFIGIYLFSNGLKYLFFTYETITKYAFIGLIFGSLPILFKKGLKDNKTFKLHYLLYTIASVLVTTLFIYIEKKLGNSSEIKNNFSFFYLIISGLFMSGGVIVPGVSSTVILMCLGVYPIYLTAIANFNINILIPIGIGLCLRLNYLDKLNKMAI